MNVFCRMKPSAFFPEPRTRRSRGRKWFDSRIAGKEKSPAPAWTCREQEPPAPGALAGMDNVILTPHIAAFTREAQDRVMAAVCQDVTAVLEGRAPKNFVNFPKPKIKL